MSGGKDMRKKIIAGNWKMNKTPSEAKALIEELKILVKDVNCDVVVCPTFVCLPAVAEAVKDSNILVGAQNMYYEENGAYTGEIAPNMLTEIGIKYVIIGHSERREYFGETDEMVNLKVKKALKHNLIPIVCVGETLKQREQGITENWIRMQIKLALNDLSKEHVKKIIIAYEPIWAIGTGKTATKEQANEVNMIIRKTITELFGIETGEKIRIQYGGSVKANNASELFTMPDIDGALVGGASLKADEFSKIINYKEV
jgi:triosephosphate isomerase